MTNACANCRKEVPEGADVCPVCAHEVGASLPAAPTGVRGGAPSSAKRAINPAAQKPGAIVAVVLAAMGLALEAAGALVGNFVLVAGGYVACSIAFRLGRTALREIDEDFAPGPRAVGRPLAVTGWGMGLAGMALGVPVGVLAWLFSARY